MFFDNIGSKFFSHFCNSLDQGNGVKTVEIKSVWGEIVESNFYNFFLSLCNDSLIVDWTDTLFSLCMSLLDKTWVNKLLVCCSSTRYFLFVVVVSFDRDFDLHFVICYCLDCLVAPSPVRDGHGSRTVRDV